ncbi:hypothetical protein [Streptomyces sp. NPDC047841]|uniref:hypothetical protein n=1 Tax=Streptomyces sp. NPDC047841 TaxID=3154708 RepID=UPI003451C127
MATRSIGQSSTLNGAIEDMLVGPEAVFPDGTVSRIKNVPRRSTGPDIRHIVPAPWDRRAPADDLWTSIGEASRRAPAAFPGDPADIGGVGLCTVRFCRALLRADGTPASPVMSWMDERVPRPYEHTDPQVRYVTTSCGCITRRLTGRSRDTAADHAGVWPMYSDTWRFSRPCSRATYSERSPLRRPRTPHEYLYESSGVRRGMWILSCFRDVLGEEGSQAAARDGTSVEEALNRGAATVPPGPDGLTTVLDWLAPTDAPYRKGSILGFYGRQGRFRITGSSADHTGHGFS